MIETVDSAHAVNPADRPRQGCGGQDGHHNGEAFWRARAKTFGHTGWADQSIYAYDQLERLSIVRAAVPKVSGATEQRALDFGCGSGDFSRLLLELGYVVCGYDPFVEPDIRSDRFVSASHYEHISDRHGAHVVLSVTALDHITDGDELDQALHVISECLRPDGLLYMIEYALDSPADRDRFGLRNDYQSFRTMHEWAGVLAAHSLRIVDVAPLPHPHVNPSRGYVNYSGLPLARLRRRYPHLPLARVWCDPVLKWRAATLVDSAPASTSARSVLKFVRCEKAPSGPYEQR